ncbi:MAG: hypothetical protein MZU97_24925 [Bacillus subtilis]|nr:hypothetical protein [Bacillus subtilis]
MSTATWFAILFGSLGDSQLMLIAVDVFLVPMIEDPEGELNLLITIPEDLDWATEFNAIGELIAAILDADITIAELQEGSFPVIINALSQIDFTLVAQFASRQQYDGQRAVRTSRHRRSRDFDCSKQCRLV